MISYKYPILPNKITQWKLAENLDACRWLYNRLLQDLNEAKEKGIKLKTYDTQNMIPSMKLENPKLNRVYSKVLQMVNYTLWSNFKGLAASKMNGRKIGDMRIKIYRKIKGCIKAVIIKREGERWFAIVQADQEPQPLPETGEAIGLDVGLTSFVVDSEGNGIENPRCAEQSEDKLAGLQRKLARAVKGSKNYGVIKGKIANLHNNGMHRSIHDASWSKFIFMLSYKAQSAGRKLIKVDPRNTTQRCSACGSIVKKDLSVRVHECPYCGFSCDRDYNASRNILFAGMEQPVAPIESKPLHHITVMQVLAMTWEAAPFRTR